MDGKIIKGIAGFYYVHIPERGIYECRAKGIFRKNQLKPLVGDQVRIEELDEAEKTGVVAFVYERKNLLIRPAVANIDQALVVFSIDRPAPNLNLLDRFLILMEAVPLPAVICFNKTDYAKPGEIEALKEIYGGCGCQVLWMSALQNEGGEELFSCLKGKTSTLAGPSGVGKSSILNLLSGRARAETGSVSKKQGRGRHTTRHTELIPLREGSYLVDTPGFSALDLQQIQEGRLPDYYQEFAPYQEGCRFNGCTHIHEPGCLVKEAVEEARISKVRYQNYTKIYQELSSRRKY